jgi:hypothetical protein
MSAWTDGAFSRKRSFDPGVEKQDRRGRLRLRSDIQTIVVAVLGALRRDQVGGRELLTQKAREPARVLAYEPAAQLVAFDVTSDVCTPRGMEEELDGLFGALAGKQRPTRDLRDHILRVGTLFVQAPRRS